MKLLLKHIFFCLTLSFSYGQKAFEDVTAESGIDHLFDIYQGLFGGGVTAFDYNNDGFEDLFITGGKSQDILYRNNGDKTFTDVTKLANLSKENFNVTVGVVSSDVNKDGFIDLFLSTIATRKNGEIGLSSNILYRNNGDGTFTDVTKEYKLTKTNFSTSASFGDINADGYPDLFVGNYFKDFYFQERLTSNLAILNHYTINEDYEPAYDELYLNVEGKYFKNISDKIDVGPGYGFGGVFTDIDNDNDLDLYIINDFGEQNIPNQLLVNQYPKLEFINESKKLKIDFPLKSMGVAVGDYNNDNYLDYHITNIFAGPFIVNRGKNKPFINLSRNIGTGLNRSKGIYGYPEAIIGWGSIFLDYDNDTDLDLFNANGPINPLLDLMYNTLFENKGRVFTLNEKSGIEDFGIARGTAHFDYDNDGDQDIFIVNQRPVYDLAGKGGTTKSILYKNTNENGNNWLKVKLVGKESTSRGLGARIKVVSDDLNMIREVDGGSSHASQNSSIIHFGLGQKTSIDSLIVSWPNGKIQFLKNLESNQLIEVKETTDRGSFLNKVINSFKID